MTIDGLLDTFISPDMLTHQTRYDPFRPRLLKHPQLLDGCRCGDCVAREAWTRDRDVALAKQQIGLFTAYVTLSWTTLVLIALACLLLPVHAAMLVGPSPVAIFTLYQAKKRLSREKETLQKLSPPSARTLPRTATRLGERRLDFPQIPAKTRIADG